MEDLNHYINKLQKVSADIGYQKLKWELPEIVVIGNQSDGKSSVLESIVGEDFLPKGRGMVTQRPLVLQLHHIRQGTKERSTNATKWAVYEGNVITDFQLVKQNIEAANRSVPKNDISDKPIFLEIYAPDVIEELTLVDLPGLFKVKSDDQADGLPQRIENLVRERVSRRNTIMLVVASATSDLNTSVALELAKDVDPDGERTLVVLTKLDMEDKANLEKITNTILGNHIKVKLGIIAVINRSETDVKENKTVKQKRKEEQEWLEAHLDGLSQRNGTAVLSKRLSRVLGKHIQKCIPDMSRWIDEAMIKHREIAVKFAPDNNGFVVDKETVVFKAIRKFCDLVHDIVEGYGIDPNSNEILGGRRIYNVFFPHFASELKNAAEPLLDREHIRIIAQNCGGVRTRMFISHEALEGIAKGFIKNIRTPSILVADQTKVELDTIIGMALSDMSDTKMAFPNLMERIVDEATKFLKTRLTETVIEIEKWIESERDCLNFNHMDFDDFFKDALEARQRTHPLASASVANKTGVDLEKETVNGPEANLQILPGESKAVSSALEIDLHVVETTLRAYIRIMQKIALDRVPKIVMSNLVKKVSKELIDHLQRNLYNAGNFEYLVAESDELVAEREKAHRMLQVCEATRRAFDELQASQNVEN